MKKGWEIKKLGEVCDFQNGFAFKSNTYKEVGLPILRITNIQDQSIEIDNLVYFDLKDYKENFDRFIVTRGDLVIAMSGATTGKLGINNTNVDFYLNQRVGKFNPRAEILKSYLYYFLSTKIEESLKIAAGAAQPNLSTEQINNFQIPLPPLTEQQRIVSILDQAFIAIDKAKANAEKNLKNAKALFESYLQGVFENVVSEEKSIQVISKVINGYAFESKDFKSSNTVKSIKITNVGVKEFIEETDNFLPEKYKDTLKEVQVKKGNIVIALTRTIISSGLKVAIVPESYDGALLNQRVAALIPNEKIINQRYLYYFLTTNGVSKYVLAHVNTLMQPNLSINDLKKLPIPCPSISEQEKIINILDQLRNEIENLKSIYQKKVNDLEELKKSFLQKAFTGQLSESEISGLENVEDKKANKKRVQTQN